MENPLQILDELGKSGISDEEFVSFNLKLRKPVGIGYTIRSFIDEKEDTDATLFEKKIKLLHGVDSNFEYKMIGNIHDPKEFKEKRCDVLINPLAGSTYFEYALKGKVGDGWYEKGEFLFRLYISPQMAKDIINWREIDERMSIDVRIDDEEWVWMRLRIDVVNYRHIGKSNQEQVWFDIVRVYC